MSKASFQPAMPFGKRAKYLLRGFRDQFDNRGRARTTQRLLFITHPTFARRYYGIFLDWVAQQFPEINASCEMRSIPFSPRRIDRYRAAMSWIGDSNLAPGSWERAAMQRLNEALAAHEIPLVNPWESTLRSAKHEGAEIMATAGLATPRSLFLHNHLAFQRDPGTFPFPLLIRENHGHAGRNPISLFHNPGELRRADLSSYRQPIAVEFIDVREANGHCRRYRYVGVGELGYSYNVHVSKSWEVRGQVRVDSAEVRKEEAAFVAGPNPHHVAFQRAREALGLELVGFDYSYDIRGNLVVWEANSLPGLTFVAAKERAYLNPVVARVYAALLRHLLIRGGLPVPQRLDDLVLSPAPLTRRAA